MKEVSDKVNGFDVSGIVLEQNQPIRPLLQHLSRLVEGAGMVEVHGQRAAIPFQNLANEKEVFLLLAHQQDSQRNGSGFCSRAHRSSSITSYHRNISRRGLVQLASIPNPMAALLAFRFCVIASLA